MMDDAVAPVSKAAAAANAAQRLRPRGSNQIGMRQFNERVVLQAIRLHGALPQAEIARLTRLTAQTVSLIIARLEGDSLLLRMDPVRGKVGQPSVPIALNPDGAFSIGIKIGRRSMDVLLVDFTGRVRERLSLDYAFPDPDTLFGEIDAAPARVAQVAEAGAARAAARHRHRRAAVARRMAAAARASSRRWPTSGTASTFANVSPRRARRRGCRSSS